MKTPSAPITMESNQHSIQHRDISKGALQTIKTLDDAGFSAYLVGGGVRDLLLGGHPKDFDVATNATPEQIKQLFNRQARIIGRRFRIVHVRVGRDVTEVTTFRAHHENTDNHPQAVRSGSGMLLRDNVYGDICSDAMRRDFTMNALYYSPRTGAITDFTDGIKAVKARTVKMIGEPELRYREDPVRMLRAVRLAAKLKFTIDSETAAPILTLGPMLGEVAPARLFDECLKLFMSGYAATTFEHLQLYKLFDQLFPVTEGYLEEESTCADQSEIGLPSAHSFQSLLRQAMANTDERIHSNKRVTPAFILAVILWPPVILEQKRLLDQGYKPAPALNTAAHTIINRQIKRVAIPRRFTLAMREIWELQLRLPRRRGNQAWRLMEHPRLRAAYDFLLLREQSGEDHQGLGQWWTDFQAADTNERESLLKPFQGTKSERKRPPRKRRSNPVNEP